MINKLTKEQEEKFQEYVDKWVKIGLDATPINLKEAIPLVNDLYKKILKKGLPKKVIIMESPTKAWEKVCKLCKAGEEESKKFVWPYLDGNFNVSYSAFYDFMFEELKAENKEKGAWEVYKALSKLSLIYPLDEVCVLVDKPEYIKMEKGQLHCSTGPSIKYKDGFCIYSLNGVRVSKELVETPLEKLDPKLVMTEKNAEVRREIVRKIGIERFIQKCGAKSLDKSKDGMYELLGIDIGDGRIRPYLKMRNPSIATWHVEGVHPNCKTVADALKFRNGTTEVPSHLS